MPGGQCGQEATASQLFCPQVLTGSRPGASGAGRPCRAGGWPAGAGAPAEWPGADTRPPPAPEPPAGPHGEVSRSRPILTHSHRRPGLPALSSLLETWRPSPRTKPGGRAPGPQRHTRVCRRPTGMERLFSCEPGQLLQWCGGQSHRAAVPAEMMLKR